MVCQGSNRYIIALFVGLCVLQGALASSAPAADSVTQAPQASPTIERKNLPTPAQIETKLAEVDASSVLDEAGKAALTEQYRRILSNLEAIKAAESKAGEFTAALATAPTETTAIQRRLETAAPPDDKVVRLPEDIGTDEITHRLGKLISDVAIEQARIAALDELIERSMSRPAEIRSRLVEIRAALEQVESDLSQPRPEGQPVDVAEARLWGLESRRLALQTEARMLDNESLSLGVRETLHRTQREEASRQWEALRVQQRQLEELQNQRRRAEAEEAQRASELARIEAADKHRLVQEAARYNAQITASTGQLAEKIETFDQEVEKLNAERSRIEQDFKTSQQRVEAAGLTRALGQILLERRDQLPDLRQHRRAIQTREDAIVDATLRQIRYREEQRQLRELDAYLDELTGTDPSAQVEEVRAQLRSALEQRQRLISQAIAVEDDHIRQLHALNDAADQLLRATERFDAFLSERLLWVRSSLPVGLATLPELPSAFAWLVSHRHWLEVVQVLAYQTRHSLTLWLGTLLVGILFWRTHAIRRAIRATNEALRRARTDHILHSARAIGLSLMVALPLPLALWWIGRELTVSPEATLFARALGQSLMIFAIPLYLLRAFRALCLPEGVAERHFNWSREATRRIRWDFDWFSIYVFPLGLLTTLLYRSQNPDLIDGLGRLALVATMLGFSLFFYHVLSPKRGAISPYLTDQPNGWLNRLRHLWFPVIVGAPLGLALLGVLGYVYTAAVLFQSLVNQMWLFLCLVVLHQLIVRWLTVTRRRLTFQAAVERVSARRAQAEADRGETTTVSNSLQVEESEPDLAALDEQSRQLINATVFVAAGVGTWIIWSGVLPALSLFKGITLWYYTGLADGVEQPIPVTVASLGLVLLIASVAVVAARNLPALIEILLLHTDSVSAGGRYAIKTLVSYSITVLAFMLAFGTLGLNWGQVQWLVAALGVGIGFGLQEIVANFISGIIILFERPVRVGDIVTIGDTTGVVTNIQIRATTIRNWDKQELLVPNKEFITGRLLNWSLSDQQNRITIPVGIEYGSDARLALEILAEVAAEHARVLDDPAPIVGFEGFGENALTLTLRCYMETLDGRLGVITDLHQAIYERFRERGIGMAFPQRDVHLSTRQPLEIRLQRSGPR